MMDLINFKYTANLYMNVYNFLSYYITVLTKDIFLKEQANYEN
jgi:hypothetical protein